MNTVLVWILLNAVSGRTASPYYFANQADCLRVGTQLTQAVKVRAQYTCVPERIATRYTEAAPPAPSPRAVRNYRLEQAQINRILSNPPHYQPGQP